MFVQRRETKLVIAKITICISGLVRMTHSIIVARALTAHKCDRTRGIQGAGPFSNGLKVGSSLRVVGLWLVGQRPHDDCWIVLVSLDQL